MSATEQRPPLLRLTKVELRKMVDTRSGFWLLSITVGLTLLVLLAIAATAEGADLTNSAILSVAVMPATLLVPVLGVLLASSEFSARSALTTFTLVPQRGRVVAAKLLAGIVLALVVSAVLVLGTLLTGAFLSGPTESAVDQPAFTEFAARTTLTMLMAMVSGLAFGLLVRNSALAIALYFMLPTLLTIPFEVIDSIRSAAPWVTQQQWGKLMVLDDVSSKTWAQIGASSLIWLFAMLAAGLWRLERSEIK